MLVLILAECSELASNSSQLLLIHFALGRIKSPTPLTNALVTSGRPIPADACVNVFTPYEDVMRVTTGEADAAMALVRASHDRAETLGAWPEVEAVHWRTFPSAGALTRLIFISVEEV